MKHMDGRVGLYVAFARLLLEIIQLQAEITARLQQTMTDDAPEEQPQQAIEIQTAVED